MTLHVEKFNKVYSVLILREKKTEISTKCFIKTITDEFYQLL